MTDGRTDNEQIRTRRTRGGGLQMVSERRSVDDYYSENQIYDQTPRLWEYPEQKTEEIDDRMGLEDRSTSGPE